MDLSQEDVVRGISIFFYLDLARFIFHNDPITILLINRDLAAVVLLDRLARNTLANRKCDNITCM